MGERLKFIWDIVWKAEVIGRSYTVAPILVAVIFALAQLAGWLPNASPAWWAYLGVGFLVSLILAIWEVGSVAHGLVQDRIPKLSVSDPIPSPVLSSQTTLKRFHITITNESYGPVKGCSVKEFAFGKVTGQITGLNRPFIQSHEQFAQNMRHAYSTCLSRNVATQRPRCVCSESF